MKNSNGKRLSYRQLENWVKRGKEQVHRLSTQLEREKKASNAMQATCNAYISVLVSKLTGGKGEIIITEDEISQVIRSKGIKSEKTDKGYVIRILDLTEDEKKNLKAIASSETK